MSKLFLGGVRSGKSAIAENFCISHTNFPIAYVATAQRTLADNALKKRISTHANRRDAKKWHLIEAQKCLKSAVILALEQHERVLIDSIDMWLALLDMKNEKDRQYYDAFLSWVTTFSSSDKAHRLIMVSSEVGLAPISADNSIREFVDNLGLTNQQLALICDEVSLCVAGLEMPLKNQ